MSRKLATKLDSQLHYHLVKPVCFAHFNELVDVGICSHLIKPPLATQFHAPFSMPLAHKFRSNFKQINVEQQLVDIRN